MLPRVHHDVVDGVIASVKSDPGYVNRVEALMIKDNPEVWLCMMAGVMKAAAEGQDHTCVYATCLCMYDYLRIQDEINELENV